VVFFPAVVHVIYGGTNWWRVILFSPARQECAALLKSFTRRMKGKWLDIDIDAVECVIVLRTQHSQPVFVYTEIALMTGRLVFSKSKTCA
jgi:hypothetical protein